MAGGWQTQNQCRVSSCLDIMSDWIIVCVHAQKTALVFGVVDAADDTVISDLLVTLPGWGTVVSVQTCS